MNLKQRGLVDLLRKMRDLYGVIAVKAEFEAEGTCFDELVRLKNVAVRAGLDFFLKIGGPEDVWGIIQARTVGVSHIVAPMVESAYGLSKFLDAARKFIPSDELEELTLGINVETAAAVRDLDAILQVGAMGRLHSVTVGRVDLVGSLGLDRKAINSDKVSEIVEEICRKAKDAHIRATLGGGIEKESYGLLSALMSQNLLALFETRKIVFSQLPHSIAKYEEAVTDAHRFELGWYESECDWHRPIIQKDEKRIPLLQKRIGI